MEGKCLRRSIAASIDLAARHGQTFDDWFRKQRPDEPQYVQEYFTHAAVVGQGVDWASFGGNTVAVAPA